MPKQHDPKLNREGRGVLKHPDPELDKPLWGVPAIAGELHLTMRQAYHALERGYLPANKVGGRWVSTPRRLRAVYLAAE
jgi:hypothetical protein